MLRGTITVVTQGGNEYHYLFLPAQELFYLLDSMDSTGRGGVVTTQSLAVELQAGGLTQEHVEYVSGIRTLHGVVHGE